MLLVISIQSTELEVRIQNPLVFFVVFFLHCLLEETAFLSQSGFLSGKMAITEKYFF